MPYEDICINLVRQVDKLPLDEKVSALNHIRQELHKISPFKDEPVDCVLWIKGEKVVANDYNPNVVALLLGRALKFHLRINRAF